MQIVVAILLGLFCLLVNIPLGRWRGRYPKFTVPWWLLIHASVPVVIALRIWLQTSHFLIPVYIGLAVCGQFIGGRKRIKSQNL